MSLWPDLENELVYAAGRTVAAHHETTSAQPHAGSGRDMVVMPRRHRRRNVGRRSVIAATLSLLAAFGGVSLAGVINPFAGLSRDRPVKLFQANPGYWNQDNPPNSRTRVIPFSVKKLTTLTVPSIGRVQYWVGRTENGRYCSALRLPDGNWAGTTVDANFNFSGLVPGCGSFASSSFGSAWSVNVGTFSIMPRPHSPPPGPRAWQIAYGVIRASTKITEVRDVTTGATAAVIDGHNFAILIPEHLVNARSTPGGCSCGPHAKIWFAKPRLEGLNARGHVTTKAPVTP